MKWPTKGLKLVGYLQTGKEMADTLGELRKRKIKFATTGVVPKVGLWVEPDNLCYTKSLTQALPGVERP